MSTIRHSRPHRLALALGLALVGTACGRIPGVAQDAVYTSERHAYRVVTVAQGLEHPWGMTFLPNGAMLVTERAGRLRVIRGGALQPEPVVGVPEVLARGQGGLLDVAIHPEFARNGYVYLSYSKPGTDGATTAVARGRLDGNRLVDVRDIFVANAWGRPGVHFGSRLLFDRDGFLYVTIGDRGTMQRAQNRGDHAGTTLRLRDDGSVPADNPFVGQAGVLPEIFTYGNRNAQGMTLHPVTGEVWQTEHGPRGGDEVNLIRAGRNYGWPVITYGINYDGTTITGETARDGMEQPLHHWTPSIAAAGMTFYTGDRFPEWRGNLFVAALAGQHVARVTLNGTTPSGQEQILRGAGERFRSIVEGPDGYLYLLTDSGSGRVLRVEPAS
jgi:aldose sugar dehydrogenase